MTNQNKLARACIQVGSNANVNVQHARVSLLREQSMTKEEKAAWDKAYHQAHKAEIAARKKAYRQAHKAEQAARDKTYYQGHKAEIAAYWQAHKPEMAAYNNAYRLANLDKFADKASQRRALKLRATVERVSRAVVYERDGGRCHLCGKKVNPKRWHLDHITPLARGGEHSYRNVAVSCPKCNMSKGIKAGAQLRLIG